MEQKIANAVPLLGGPELLKKVVVYARGDAIQHRGTGRAYTVDFVRISGHQLNIMTTDGVIFKEKDIYKVPNADAMWLN